MAQWFAQAWARTHNLRISSVAALVKVQCPNHSAITSDHYEHCTHTFGWWTQSRYIQSVNNWFVQIQKSCAFKPYPSQKSWSMFLPSPSVQFYPGNLNCRQGRWGRQCRSGQQCRSCRQCRSSRQCRSGWQCPAGNSSSLDMYALVRPMWQYAVLFLFIVTIRCCNDRCCSFDQRMW